MKAASAKKNSRSKAKKTRPVDPYRLYELSVQSPKEHTEWLNFAYK